MLTVACVLKSGGEFTWEHVYKLAAAVRLHLKEEHQFWCYTDLDPATADSALVGIESVEREDFTDADGQPIEWRYVSSKITATALENDWPGWWAKLEVFRHPGPLLYLDLDTVVVGDLAPFAEAVEREPRNSLLMIRDFYRKHQQSGLLGWSGDMSAVYARFRNEWAPRARFEPRHHGTAMTANGVRLGGDGDWLRREIQFGRLMWEYFERHADGICSYKVHVRGETRTSRVDADASQDKGLPPGARVVCFHGKPRPWDLKPRPEWLAKAWVEDEPTLEDEDEDDE